MTAFLLLVAAAGLVLEVVAFVDVARRPASQLAGVGGKGLWCYLLAVGLVIPGGPIALLYLLAVPKRAAGSADRV